MGYVWVIALRELLRIPRIPVEIRRGSVALTGKRLPGPVGAWLHDPAVVKVNMFRKLPATLLTDSTTPDPPANSFTQGRSGR